MVLILKNKANNMPAYSKVFRMWISVNKQEEKKEKRGNENTKKSVN